MRPIIIVATLLISSQVYAKSIADVYKIPSTGVLAHIVLSQAELAKERNLELNKTISIEKLRSEAIAVINKTTELKFSLKEKISNFEKMGTLSQIEISKANSLAELTSYGLIWTEDTISEINNTKYVKSLKKEINNLKTLTKELYQSRIKIEKFISFSQINSIAQKEKIIRDKKSETKRLLEAKDDEFRKIIKDKLILGNLEYNIYYVTGDYIPEGDEYKLLKKVFLTLSKRKDIHIKIIGRADPRGNYNYNKELARNRADFILSIAVNAGIPQDSISASSHVSNVEIKRNRELHFFDRNTTVIIDAI